jgi:hypothetical protein
MYLAVMKRIAPLILFLSCFQPASAQSDSEQTKKNIVKVNLSSVVFQAASLQYERVIGARSSLCLNVIYRPEAIFNPRILKTNASFKNASLQSYSITPSIRYYAGLRSPLNFYGEFYLRYRSDKINGMHTPSSSLQFITSGQEKIYSVGTMVGYQVLKGKNFYIDFWVFGLGLGQTNIALNAIHQPKNGIATLDDSDKTTYDYYLRNTFGDAGIIEWEGNKARYKQIRTLTAFRGLGLNIGIGF